MQTREDGPLLVRQEGTTAILTLHRPAARNALDAEVLGRLREAVIVESGTVVEGGTVIETTTVTQYRRLD